MSAAIEDILVEIGKAFRLCRFYPATHPSVRQAMAEVSSRLPALADTGSVELKITPTGFAVGTVPLAPRNPPVQEFASLLFAQGNRALHFEPGLTVDEVAALIRAATSSAERTMQALGGTSVFEQLPHIRLERAGRKTPRPGAAPSPSSVEGGLVLGRRSVGVFRPGALPPEIEAARLATQLEEGSANAEQAVGRLGELLPDIIATSDHRTLVPVVLTLGRVASGTDPVAAQAARQVMAERVSAGALAMLVARLGDARLPAQEREDVGHAVSALGARAIGVLADQYLVSSEPETRETLLAVVRRAGAAAAEPLLSLADPDAPGDVARDYALLLGATGAPSTALVLGAFAMHAEAAVREAAVAGLARLDDPEAVRHTIGALKDGDPGVRATAARGVVWYGGASTTPILIWRLKEEEDDGVAVALIEALGELRDARAVEVLAEIAGGKSGIFQRHPTAVRVAAVRALGAIGTPEARAEVRSHLGSHDAEVREAAGRALAS